MSTKAFRATQYYNFNEVQENLYQKSKEGNSFKNLLDIITSDENILLAYRIIKSNDGAKTSGTDKQNIKNIANMEKTTFISHIKETLMDYKPHSVRRVLIDKPGGGKRPLGIPTIRDRIIQQMFKQVLEPICEAKFQKISYGFRPKRTTRHAIAKVQSFINIYKLYFSVDIDIKGFFDNVNHSLLMKQLWNIGIRDKRVLAIIGKMLKAPIKGEGIQKMGVPQGGVLSPLLSNVVLNDLDKWVMNQWESFETDHTYAGNDVKIRELRRTSKLKEGYIVRYADDFRVMTRDKETAIKWFHALKGYLKDRLKLDISPEKSQIVDVRKRSTVFLGYKIKAVEKKKKLVAKTNVSDKKLKEMQKRIKERILAIKKEPSPGNVSLYNSTVLGMQQSFKHATHVSPDFGKLENRLWKYLYNSLHGHAKYQLPNIKNKKQNSYTRIYGKNTRRTFVFKSGIFLYPISKVKTVKNKLFSYEGSPYKTEVNFSWDIEIIELMKRNIPNATVEYMDNRLSKYSMQKGLCHVTKTPLKADDVHCHHKKPKELGGTDEFKNLVVVHKFVHKLIHATKPDTINKYMRLLNLGKREVDRVNKLRAKCKLGSIGNE
ncbi:group II intron reverse transcriptase/maturase (plasmid) [Rossellomorea sp. AcN35-11]|nr:group II intron reverse transcriptase/maturase [Rossellomorea aquimaris]WJV32260.1 group II intron reverse transcriptase/maturase [Rossellomorea sp. AcN35-11]